MDGVKECDEGISSFDELEHNWIKIKLTAADSAGAGTGARVYRARFLSNVTSWNEIEPASKAVQRAPLAFNCFCVGTHRVIQPSSPASGQRSPSQSRSRCCLRKNMQITWMEDRVGGLVHRCTQAFQGALPATSTRLFRSKIHTQQGGGRLRDSSAEERT